MRRAALPAVLIALACVPAADACFLKKLCCWGGGGEPVVGPAAGPETGPVVAPVPTPGPQATAKIPTSLSNPVIVSVGGQTPVSGNIPNAVDSTQPIVIVVHTSFDPGSSSELTVDDLGPVITPTAPRGKAKDKDTDLEKGPPTPAPGSKKHYRPKQVIKKDRPKVEAAPAPAAAGPTLGGTSYWEALYEIPANDLARGHRYRAVATAGGLSSNPVTFMTQP